MMIKKLDFPEMYIHIFSSNRYRMAEGNNWVIMLGWYIWLPEAARITSE